MARLASDVQRPCLKFPVPCLCLLSMEIRCVPLPSFCDLHSPDAVQRSELLGPQGSICNLSYGDFTVTMTMPHLHSGAESLLHPNWHLAVSVALAIVSQFCRDFSPSWP